MSRALLAARIARHDIAYAVHVLEDGFDAPEASAGKHRGLQRTRGFLLVLGRDGSEHGGLGECNAAAESVEGEEQYDGRDQRERKHRWSDAHGVILQTAA